MTGAALSSVFAADDGRTAPRGSAEPGNRPLCTIFGIRFTPLTIAAAAEAIAERPPELPFDYVVTPNAGNIAAMHRARDDLAGLWNGAWLTLLDGAIVQIFARLAGARLPLAPGSDLTAYLFASGIVRPDEPVTIIGCSPAAIETLKTRYGLKRVLHHDPPMGFIDDPAAVARAIDFIAAARTRLVFCAIGAPQAQRFAWQVRADGRATGLGLCIGASLNFLAGIERRAPRWMRACRLEWLYRTIRQPRRIGRRLLRDDLWFLPLGFREIWRRRSRQLVLAGPSLWSIRRRK